MPHINGPNQAAAGRAGFASPPFAAESSLWSRGIVAKAMARLIDFDEPEFVALSTLLSIREPQQDVSTRRAVLGDADADSSDDDDGDGDGDTEGGAAIPRIAPGWGDKEKSLARFLDHVAETFAREKSRPPSPAKRHERRHQTAKGRGAHHVAASGLAVVPDQDAVVCVAKNGGVDAADEALARLLTTWLNAMARSRKLPQERDKDVMWTKLLEYHSQRLDVYAEQIGASSPADFAAAFSDGPDAVAQDLHARAVGYVTERSVSALRSMVPLAYRLRYEPAPGALSSRSRKARLATAFLGRLLAAYENFKRMAIEFSGLFSGLSVRCTAGPEPQPRVIEGVKQRIQRLSREEGIPSPPPKKIKSVLGQGDEARCYCHAEVQVLLHLEGAEAPAADVFPYIGCSKRSCWLCHKLLAAYRDRRSRERGFYRTRGSHERVYPFWCVTEPAAAPFDRHALFFLSSSLGEIRKSMLRRLLAPRTGPAREAGAESSANVTTRGGPFRVRALAERRLAETSEAPRNSRTDMELLKDKVCSRDCFRIPGDGQECPHICPVDFYSLPSGWPGPEPPGFCVPDFREYWGMSHHHRFLSRFSMTGQEPKELNGDYFLYWCRDSTLPPNKNLTSLIGVDPVGPGDHFWNGDVFFVRIQENSRTRDYDCRDVPRSFVGLQEPMRQFFRKLWEDKVPEDEAKRSQYHDTQAEKHRADRELIRGRM